MVGFVSVSFSDDAGDLFQKIRERLMLELDSKDDLVRRMCVQSLCDCVDIFSRRELSKLDILRRTDPDWRICYHAHETLVELNPKKYGEYKLAVSDRIKARIFNPDR